MSTSGQAVQAATTVSSSPLAGYSSFGAREGFSPQISILVSQLDWMRQVVLLRLHDLTIEDLDWLPSPTANTVGALLLHLAATETYYQIHTFEGRPWGDTSPEIKSRWGAAMKLGDAGRQHINKHHLDFYIEALTEVRERTLHELKLRDDEWLLTASDWAWGPTNNFCKWFHVCEHESRHLGQIDIHLKRHRELLQGNG
jgi:uncharacterized damage-inducible protein DinB